MLSIIALHSFIGWLFWSLSHYTLHRTWHKDILEKKPGLATHGESEHHRCYDTEENLNLNDPFKALSSFPYPFILAQVALLSTWYGFGLGVVEGVSFFTSAFIWMTLDDRMHRLWHSGKNWSGLMGYLQKLHQIHHTTHKNNYSFFSGLIWDRLAKTKLVDLVHNKNIEQIKNRNRNGSGNGNGSGSGSGSGKNSAGVSESLLKLKA